MRKNNILLRKLNSEGEKKFEEFFNKKIKDKKTPVPFKLLEAENFTEKLDKNIEIDVSLTFDSAFEFGKYLSNKLKNLKSVRFETGIFHWLTLAYFNILFPGPLGGSQKIKYILSNKTPGNWKKHLVRLRWELYDKFGDKSLTYLSKPVNNWSDEEESISASPTLIASENIIDLYKELYFRYDKNKNPKIISRRNKPGNHREFTRELSIYQLNFHIHKMSIDEILELLGDDFKDWRKIQ